MFAAFVHNWLSAIVAFAIVLTVYIKWIRPTIRNLPHIKDFYDQADSFWARLLIRMRAAWDLVVSTVFLAVPQLPDVLQQLGGIDWSAFVMTETQKLITQGIAIALIVLRAVNLKKTS